MPEQGSIFLTTENLAFSLPLILLCGGYAFVQFIPLRIGIYIMGGIFALYSLRYLVQSQRQQKLSVLDYSVLKGLVDDSEEELKRQEQDKKVRAAKFQVEARLRKEQKWGKNVKKMKGSTTTGSDDVDVDDLLTFAGKKK